MATEFILIPKHKYKQLQKDASRTVEDLPIQNHQQTTTTTVLVPQQVILK